MPNRILREGILTSERVDALNWEAEVFYRRLMSVVDDFGRFTAHPSLLRAALFPLKLDTVRDANMERLLAFVEQARLVRVYEVAGKRYLELLDFKQQVRAKESKYPQPPADDLHPPSICAADAKQMPASAHLDGDGDGDDTPPNPPEGVSAFDRFDRFWRQYPKKVGKDAARKAFGKRNPDDALLAMMLSAIVLQASSEGWKRENGRFIPNPATWLNQGRWQDGGSTDSAESCPDWATDAGFPSVWEAQNAGCNVGNSQHFRDGKRIEVAA